MLREKVLYFVYGLRKSIQNCVWLGLVLVSWMFIFNAKLHKKNKLLEKVFQALVAVLIGATIWLIKIILVKVLASSFHVTTYFDRMKESVFHHYVLETLSGRPMDEFAYQEAHCRNLGVSKSLPTKLRDSRVLSKSKRLGTRKIDIENLKKLSMQRTASAWTVKRLVNYVRSFGLTTISKTVDEFGRTESEITSEWEARSCAKRIFKNVAKPGAKYIEEEDLMRFLQRVEIHTIFPLFEGSCLLRTEVFSTFLKRHKDSSPTAPQASKRHCGCDYHSRNPNGDGRRFHQNHSLHPNSAAATRIHLPNMCKTVFESIVFVFVMHPFDIGDRCVIDGVQLIVEEMNILTTVFLRYDNEKIYYPNSVLITKPISNFYRSPEMCDTINFNIDVSTPMETIIGLKKAIQTYIESKPKYWNPKHSVIVKEIENVHEMKMALSVQHTINHQNYGDRNVRVTELILELKKMFENLNIKYHLLPQEIHLTQVNWNPQMPLMLPS
ncbi:UNVERIFIED_CONTAM: Mechanosensitive ion channel protein 10 [Sesamum calycinum]|uniref:Mechanosensitive ion channel protein 10 n=1 Tax=Sesamum calycinum TaxID=2727403 RepID=A0AAW2LXN3_9LAMI